MSTTRPPKLEYDKAKTMALICERMGEGESLRSICKEPGLPTVTTVMRWLDEEKNAALREHYARAREALADHYAEAIIEIVDSTVLDPNDKRVRMDARKWVAGKMAPKKYGDKVDLGVGQSENLAPTKAEITYRWES